MRNITNGIRHIMTFSNKPLSVVLATHMCLVATSAEANTANTLVNISSNVLSPSQTELRIQFSSTPIVPKAYQLKNPARLVLDLPATKNGLASRVQNFNTPQITGLTAIDNKKTTRLIIALKSQATFATRTDGNTLILKVTSGTRPTINPLNANQPTKVYAKSSQAYSNPLLDTNRAKINNAKYALTGLRRVNFNKTDGNAGKVSIVLQNANIPVDVQRKGTKIIVRMLGAKVPKNLRRRMNVKNFGTPVKNIDAFNDGNNGMIVIQPDGEFDYQVYQADSSLTVEVNPIVRVTDLRPKPKKYTGEPLSMDFQDVEIRAVLQLIADFTNLNLVAGDSVNGRMTLRLQNVPWDQALDIILNSRGLGMRKNGNVVMIAPAKEIIANEREAIESKNKFKQLEKLRTEYIQLNYAKAADMLIMIGERGSKDNRTTLLSSRGTAKIDARTNTLIIQDTSDKIDEIRALVNKLDIPVKQVMIEARIVRASDSFSKELGVKWGVLSNGAATNRSLLVGASDDTLWNLKEFDIETQKVGDTEVSFPKYTIERPANLNVDLGVGKAGASKIAFGLLELSDVMLDLELSALQADGRGEVVSTPKVLTADKQTAMVAAGTQLPYQQASASGATAVSFIKAELSLEVTPSITPEGKVAMQLKINSDSPGEVQGNGIRAIDTNRIDTNVLVDDGQTVVLGGIFQNQTTNNVTKTPFLGDLPVVGRLFRRTINNNSKQELLIFVTPRLVNEDVSNVGR